MADKRGMPVQMICPNLRCRKLLSVPDEVRGKLAELARDSDDVRALLAFVDSAERPLLR